jgi:16S rRNA (cytosine1402-N4)-methyltransferase
MAPETDPEAYHVPVLRDEVLALLEPAACIVDGTLGGGGHAAALLARGARVIGVDRDPEARAAAGSRLAPYVADGRLRIVAATFADAVDDPTVTAQAIDGVLLDLGISSHQIDDTTRGFSFREGAPLDMRMGAHGASAADWLNAADVDTLTTAFRELADEPRARPLANVIIKRRQRARFATADDLVGAVREALGARSGPGDFARLFQAVRIVVNDELGELARALPGWRDRLAPGGILAVIAYHSGEDRMVKQAFQRWSTACTCPPRHPFCQCGGVALGASVTRKPIQASPEEVARNPRARSAKLRAWRRAE